MKQPQIIALLTTAVISFAVFLKGLVESKKGKAYELTPFLLPFGIIAWGDAVVFGLFWTGVSLVSYFLNDWILFLLIISVFWVVRSLGETIYWFNQQFSQKAYDWNKPEKLLFHSIFKNDSIWFVYQIIWQCVTVVSIIATIYFTRLWFTASF
jgi:hypothetical protein